MKRLTPTAAIVIAFIAAVAAYPIIREVIALRQASQPQASERAAGKVPEKKPAEDAEAVIPDPVPVSPEEMKAVPADGTALGGYDVLIADRGNNRIIEVTPDKRIVWEFDFDLPRPGLGADDAFFADGGKTIVAGLEEWQTIQLIDYATKSVVWQYGDPGKPGSKDGQLHTPDDPYKLPNGNVTVADISNCRVIEISPDKKIVRQYGVTRKCGKDAGLLDKPNGDTPLPNGHTLVSDIQGHTLIELDENWKPVFSMVLPLSYPSDPQMTKAGNILVAGYTDPGKIIEVTREGKVVWQQAETSGPLRLRHPSLAEELPNGNIIANDDQNHRVIVIDKTTHGIIWQYGVTGKPGRAAGQLNVPDGVDVIQRGTKEPAAPSPAPVRGVGAVSRHPAGYAGTTVSLRGYVLKAENGYVIISDEAGGAIGYYDLPVTGDVAGLDAGRPYVFTGVLVKGGLAASNRNPYHLELSGAPSPEAR